MLISKKAIKYSEEFIQSLINDELKLDIEPQPYDEIDITEDFLQKKLDSYELFLKSDICKYLFEESEKPL